MYEEDKMDTSEPERLNNPDRKKSDSDPNIDMHF
jgi:hypothetical protein